MDLAQLRFDVDTKKLEDAVKAVNELGVSVSNLNKITKEEAQAAINSEKVKQQQAKTAKEVAAATEAETKAETAKQKATKESTQSTKENTTVLERQKSILEFMTQGYSKGQASVLAYAKASNSATSEIEELGKVLEVQRKLMGASPFDKSMSGLVALKNQYGEVREAIRQYNSDSGLTANQTRELARDKERIIEKLKQEGATLSHIKDQIRQYNAAYVETASKVNSLVNVEKSRIQSMREHANALRNVQAAEERLFATVAHVNDGLSQNSTLNERAALAVGSYERNLRLAGITGEQAAAKLQKFKAAQEQVALAEAKRMQNYVARGVGVQMGDVAVSLAGGMNPLLVMIQQGDQLRGLIQQAGTDTLQLRSIMNDAAAQMARSFKDVGIAIGSFVTGAVASLGKTIYDGIVNPFKAIREGLVLVTTNFSRLNEVSSEFGPAITPQLLNFRNAMDAAKTAAIGLAKIGIFAVIAAIGTLATSMFKAEQENNALVRSINLTGAALGMSVTQAKQAAMGFESFGVSTTSAIATISEMAKQGISGELLDTVVTTASAMKTAFGQSAEDTVKKFKELEKDPVKALVKLAQETGNVDIETIRLIETLVKAGDSYAAVGAASVYAGAAMQKAASDAETELGHLATLGISIKKIWDETWSAIMGWGRKDLATGLEQAKKNLADALRLEVDASLDAGFSQAQRELAEAAVKSIEREIEAQNEVAKARKKASDAASNFEKEKQALEGLDKFREELAKKSLTREQYIASEIEKRRKVSADAVLANEKELVLMLGKEWDNAHKQTEKSDKVLNAYNSTLERFSDLKIQVNRAESDGANIVETSTKAYGLLLDVMDSPGWVKWDAKKKERILLEWEQIQAIEVHNLRLKEQEKALKQLEKLWDDFDKVNLKYSTEIAAVSDELDFQYSVLGKTERQTKELTKQYEQQKNIAKINAEYEKERLELIQKYEIAVKRLSGNVFEEEAARISLENKLTEVKLKSNERVAQEEDRTRQKTLQEYDKYWKEIEAGLAEATYSALFEGGKSGAVKVKDLLKAQLKKLAMEPINILVNLVVNTGKMLLGSGLNMLTSGSTSDGLGSALGLANTAHSGYNLISAITGTYSALTTGAGALPGTTSVANAVGLAGGDTMGAFIGMNPQWTTEAGTAIGQAASSEIMANSTSMWASYGNVAAAGLSAYGASQYLTGKYGKGAGIIGGTLTGAGSMALGGAITGGLGAASIGTGASLGFAGLGGGIGAGASAGAMSGATSALAGMGPWGWVALAALAVLGSLGGKKPKSYGDIYKADISGSTLTDVAVKSPYERSLKAKDQLKAITQTFATAYEGFLTEFDTAVEDYNLRIAYRKRRSSKDWVGAIRMNDERIAHGEGSNYSIDKMATDVMTEGLVTALKRSNLPDQIKSLFGDMKLKLKFADEITANIAAIYNMNNALQEMGSSLKDFIGDMDFDKFRQEGEKNVDVISRMVSTVLSANTMFEKLGFTLFELSSVGFEKVALLQEIFGGSEELSKVLNTYYEEFFSQEEKRVNVIKDIEKQLAAAGADIATLNLGEMTRMQYRELLEGTIAVKGATDPLAIALIKLSSVFASVTEDISSAEKRIADQVQQLQEEAERAAKAAYDAMRKQLFDSLDNAYKILENAIKKEIKVLNDRNKALDDNLKLEQERLNSLVKSRDDLKAVFDFLGESIRELRKLVQSTNAMLVGEASALVKNTLSTGTLPKLDTLRSAVDTLKTNVKDSIYSTKVEQERATLLLSNDLEGIEGIAGKQLSEFEIMIENQERIIRALKDEKLAVDKQIAKLNETLELYREQIQATKDGFDGVTVAVMSVADAILNMQNALAGAMAAQSAAQSAGGVSSGVITAGTSNQSGGTWYDQSNGGGWVDSSGTWHNNVEMSPWYGGGGAGLDYATLTSIFGENNVPDTAVGHAYGGALTAEQWSAVSASSDPRGTYQQMFNAAVGASTNSWSASGETGVAITDSSGGIIQVVVGNTQEEINAVLGYHGLPSFAVGTNRVPEDMLANIHKNEAIIPAKFNPWAGGTLPVDNTALAEAVATLTEEVQMLRYEARATAINTSKMTKQLDRSSDEQDSLKVTIVSDLTV